MSTSCSVYIPAVVTEYSCHCNFQILYLCCCHVKIRKRCHNKNYEIQEHLPLSSSKHCLPDGSSGWRHDTKDDRRWKCSQGGWRSISNFCAPSRQCFACRNSQGVSGKNASVHTSRAIEHGWLGTHSRWREDKSANLCIWERLPLADC